MKNIRELVYEQLLAIGAEGLCNPDLECGCSIDDLMPCGEPEIEYCVAARRSFDSEKDDYFIPLLSGGE